MKTLLELRNVTKSFDPPSGGGAMTILREVSLRLTQGESVAVVGPSGSGKSTLLNIIGALDRPTSGEVVFAGRNLVDLDDSALSAIRNREIGFIFQLHFLLPQCTVLENVLIPTLALGKKGSNPEAIDRAKSLLERVALQDRMDFFPSVLSGGELQRVAVVRALINRPKLLLADEPTGSLDKDSSENLARLLVELNREENVSLVTVTHSNALARLMDTVYTLQNGKLDPE